MNTTIKKYILSGFIWTAIQTTGTKIISLLSQLVLAWLLLPEDFGKISIASSITAIIFIIQNFGLSDVLVSRGKSFNLLYNLAKSLSVLTAIVCVVVTGFAAFLTGNIYNDEEITYLILCFCISIPFNTLSVIADAKLRIDIKFKSISVIRLIEFFLCQFFIVGFAILDFGVYSFVLGPVISSIIRYLLLVKASQTTHLFKFTLRRYEHLIGNSFYGFIHSFLQSVIRHSDYLVLGLFVLKEEVGIYFMAYSLSVQVVSLLVNSLSPVLFPTLMKLPSNENEKIKKVLLKITLYFTMLGMPFSMLQAIVIKPTIHLFFEEKWYDCIELVQILSLGIGFNVLSSLWAPALRIISKYKSQAKFSLFMSIVFISFMFLFSSLFGSTGMAIGVSLSFILTSVTLLYFSFSNYEIKLKEIVTPIVKYFLLSFIIFGSSYYMTEILVMSSIFTLIFNLTIPLLTYFIILNFFDSNFLSLKKNIFFKIKNLK